MQNESIFRGQLRNPKKGDWTELVQKDLADFQIFLTLKEIKSLKAENFKKKVINACKDYVFDKLLNAMWRKNIKKGRNIQYSKLEIQPYHSKVNFKNKYGKTEVTNEQLLCPMCNVHIDNEENLLQCSEIVNNL